MTQEVDAQVEWTTEADLAEDTDAQMALSEDVVDEVQSDPDPSALISTLQQQLDQLKKDFLLQIQAVTIPHHIMFMLYL